MGDFNLLLKHINENNSGLGVILNPHSRLADVFNIRKAVYTLIGSVSGVGKSSFLDDSLLLRPYMKSRTMDIHFEAIYFSMERKKVFKLAKWLSWIIYYSSNKKVRIPYDVILGLNPGRKLNKEGITILSKYKDILEEITEKINIRDGGQTVASIKKQIDKKALQLGNYFHTDADYLYQNKNKIAPLKKVKKTKRGDVKYIFFKFEGRDITLEENDHIYISHHKALFFFIVIDHIGKISTKDYRNKKEAIDALDNVLAEARDKYSFSPIVVSQFNRGLADTTRLNTNKGKLEPLLEDFKDSGNTQESADLILSLFDPYRYASFNSKGFYKGYSLTEGTLTPKGIQRFRSLHVLKNSFGNANVFFGMRFTGELQWFDIMPKANDERELLNIYASIARGN